MRLDDRLFNTYVVCMPNGELHSHRKLHAFEHEYINSGDRFTVFDTPWGIRAGILICWDNNLRKCPCYSTIRCNTSHCSTPDGRYPFAEPELDETDFFLRLQNGTLAMTTLGLWRRNSKGQMAASRAALVSARAHDNGIFIIFSNGVGQDDGEICELATP